MLSIKFAAIAALIALAQASPLRRHDDGQGHQQAQQALASGDQCLQNCFLTAIVSVGATAGCNNGNDYASQAICYCRTPGLGDAYSRCLERCPAGDFDQGQQLRDKVCAAANGGGNHAHEKEGHDKEDHQHDHEHEHGHEHNQKPGVQVAGIIASSVPQAQGNLGQYANVASAAGAASASAPTQATQATQPETVAASTTYTSSQTDSYSHASSSASSTSSQTFLTPTKSYSSTASPSSTVNDLDDLDSGAVSSQVSWSIAIASTLVLCFVV
ncbi:hypothetical protein E3P92_02310 [Wallemia ichthyophaga]|nr:hypothetical protein E3P92_02310 [Wallemia ichthyophaga]